VCVSVLVTTHNAKTEDHAHPRRHRQDTKTVLIRENCRRLGWQGSWTLPRAPRNSEPAQPALRNFQGHYTAVNSRQRRRHSAPPSPSPQPRKLENGRRLDLRGQQTPTFAPFDLTLPVTSSAIFVSAPPCSLRNTMLKIFCALSVSGKLPKVRFARQETDTKSERAHRFGVSFLSRLTNV
jgi:hypothetical protein